MSRPALNVVFLGAFPYPEGMAGTKLVHRLAVGLGQCEHTSVQIVSLRQKSQAAPFAGIQQGITYQTVLPDGLGRRFLTGLPSLHAGTVRALRELYRPGCLNVVCRYGPPGIEDAAALRIARRMGYRTVFYLVEDYDVAGGISSSLSHRVQNWLARCAVPVLPRLADGLLVISRPLSEKYRRATGGRLPVHLCPVVVELKAFAGEYRGLAQPVRLLYAGSFGVKDGVEVLLDAFGELIHRGHNVRLVLSGRGEAARMRGLRERMGRMSCKPAIEERGFLSDDAYEALLNSVDIPCMTRVDTPYAQAGFPFKLAEYLASGRPVIASRMEVLEEYLCDRVNALLVKPGCAAALVPAVEWLLAHPAEALAIGRAGRQVAERWFDHLEAGRRLRDFLLELGPVPFEAAVSRKAPTPAS